MSASSDPTPGSVKSADRALTILELFAADPSARTYTDILRLSGLPKSSLHGLLVTLVRRGWLAEVAPGGAYALGSRTLEVGAAFLRAETGDASIGQVLDELAAAVGETVNVGFLDGSDVVYLAVRRSRQALSMRSAVGARVPAHATAMGKALLGGHGDDVIRGTFKEPLHRLARNTHTEVSGLLRDVEEARTRGFAAEHEEVTDGVGCVAVLVDAPGRPLGLSVSFALTRLAPGLEHKVVEALKVARDRLVAALTIDPEAVVE